MRKPRFVVPVALLTFASFVATLFPARTARADDTDPGPVADTAGTQAAPSSEPASAAADAAGTQTQAPPALNEAKTLPTGNAKKTVSGQAISVPQGSGKVQGMGE